MKKILLTLLVVLTAISVFAQKKNVILMIGDGMGINSVYMCEQYMGKDFPFTNWDTILFATTYSASCPEGYDPQKAWLDVENAIPNLEWLATCTDSAAAATALNSGLKTTNGRINYSPDGKEVYVPMGQYLKSMGYAVGSVTSVLWYDATPSAPFGHSAQRGDSVVKLDMLNHPIDVLGGTGNPYFEGFGIDRIKKGKKPSYGDFGDGSKFLELEKGKLGYKLANGSDSIRSVGKEKNPKGNYFFGVPATGDLAYMKLPISKNQYKDVDENIITLREIAESALNVLNKNPKGFYLMVEGGAIDHGNHANNWEHSVCQMASFADAIEGVCQWVEKNSSWEETLLVITADHQTGGLINADGTYWITGNKKGEKPNVMYTTGGHTNLPVPVCIKGNDRNKIWDRVKGVDPVMGKYIDNTDIPCFLVEHMGGTFPIKPTHAPLINFEPPAIGSQFENIKNDQISVAQEWAFIPDIDRVGVNEKWFANYNVFDNAKKIATDKNWNSQGYDYEDGDGWYYCKVKIPKEAMSKKYCYLFIPGADEEAWLYVNGKLAVDHSCEKTLKSADILWQEPFWADLKLYGAGDTFDVVVKVGNYVGGGGLHKGIKLYASDREM